MSAVINTVALNPQTGYATATSQASGANVQRLSSGPQVSGASEGSQSQKLSGDANSSASGWRVNEGASSRVSISSEASARLAAENAAQQNKPAQQQAGESMTSSANPSPVNTKALMGG